MILAHGDLLLTFLNDSGGHYNGLQPYAVVSWPESRYAECIFCHEIGHIFGCQHEKGAGKEGTNLLFDYGYGFRTESGKITQMVRGELVKDNRILAII